MNFTLPNIFPYIIIIASFVGGTSGITLIIWNTDNKKSLVLAALMLVSSFVLANCLIHFSYWCSVTYTLIILLIPFMGFLYTIHFIHIKIPVSFIYIILISHLLVYSLLFYLTETNDQLLHAILISGLVFGSVFLCLQIIWIRESELYKNKKTALRKVRLSWIIIFHILLISYHIQVFVFTFFTYHIPVNIFSALSLSVFILSIGTILFMFFPNILYGNPFASPGGHVFFFKKYDGSNVKEKQKLQWTEKIEQHMAEKKPFLHHHLTLEKLAKQLSMHPKHLSQTINEKFRCNFTDFINNYRVEESKKYLLKEELKRFTISGIAKESGFKSKSVFYVSFKKFTGTNPKDFIQQMQAKEHED